MIAADTNTAKHRSMNTRQVFTLADALNQPLLSTEILPGAIDDWTSIDPLSSRPNLEFPFLLLEGNLGVPKKVLYGLYVVAIGLFNSSRYSDATPDVLRALKASTSVILLANPAHQTALNFRKRLIIQHDLSAEKELDFTQLLLGGSKECAKQSIIWHHRQWLYHHLYFSTDAATPNLNGVGYQLDLPAATVRKEFAIIRQACETYPRNYHAWSHWNFIMISSISSSFSSENKAVVADELSAVRSWIEKHVSDFSAVHYLCHIARRFQGQVRDAPWQSAVDFALMADHALSLILSYPSHEALWMYLREVFCSLSREKQADVIVKISVASDSLQVRRFLAWVDMQEMEK